MFSCQITFSEIENLGFRIPIEEYVATSITLDLSCITTNQISEGANLILQCRDCGKGLHKGFDPSQNMIDPKLRWI